jgi:GNAT superfamily N-acetyltransferase
VRVEEIEAAGAPDELLRELHACDVEASREIRSGEPPMPFDQFAGYLRHPADGIRHHWLVRGPAGVDGYASMSVYGPAFTYVEVKVRPEARRLGIGAALFEQLVATAREEGVQSLFGHHADEAGAAFARHAGARDDQRDVRSRLDLPGADLPPPVVPVGIELLSWIGETPPDLLATHVAARDAMDDAPVPSGTEHPGVMPEQHVKMEKAAIARGRPPRVTVALDGNQIVAFTDLRVSAPPSAVAFTDDTATLPKARRRGLSTAVKREALRRLRDERPDVRFVITFNAEQNTAMRAVNAKLGFEPVLILTTAVVDLNPG